MELYVSQRVGAVLTCYHVAWWGGGGGEFVSHMFPRGMVVGGGGGEFVSPMFPRGVWPGVGETDLSESVFRPVPNTRRSYKQDRPDVTRPLIASSHGRKLASNLFCRRNACLIIRQSWHFVGSD